MPLKLSILELNIEVSQEFAILSLSLSRYEVPICSLSQFK